jgi:hypothetical protein
MTIEQSLDYKNQLLLADLRKDFQIDFEPKEINYCEVFSKNRHSTIYYNPKHVDNDSIAHELLHIKLDRYNYSIGNHIYLSCQNNKKLGKVFCKFLCDYIGNCLDHFKMYPSYIEMGYKPENFLINGLDEKCSLNDIKLLNLSFLGMYIAKSIDRYIGYLISIYADHVSNDYREHLRLLEQKDSNLFDIISRFWNKWKVFDIENIDPIYNSDIDLAESFISDMELWIENKKIK